MIVVNTENIPGQEYKALSLVSGVCIMSRHIGKDIGAGFRNMVGGEMKAYMDMLEESKENAIMYMIQKAQAMGADAVVNVRFQSSTIVQGGAEIIAYGTAVKFV